MGDHGEREKRDNEDRNELGPVENVSDLEPETGVGPARAAKASARIERANASGYFELEGGSNRQLGAPLSIGPEIRRDAGPSVGRYVEAYNAYALPLRSTLRAMGRLKDVSLTGAPLTPEELMRRPELAARFQRLTPETTNVDQDQAAAVWSTQQRKLTVDTQGFAAVQHTVMGAIANFRRVKAKLERKKLEAQKAEKEKQVQEIDETAATLSRIVDVSLEAATGINEFEEQLNAQVALDEHAEGLGPIDHLPKNDATNFAYGTADDPTGAGQSTKSTGQKIAHGMRAAGQVAATAKKELADTGKFGLSLDDAFKALVGGKRYVALQQDIVKLKEKIGLEELKEEREDITSATEQLKGAMIDLAASRQDIRTERIASRMGAHTFAKAVGNAPAMTNAMYAAEAYQELAAFGALAAQQRQDLVLPAWHPVFRYMADTAVQHFEVLGAVGDARTLANNLKTVQEQGAFLEQHVPEWQKVAQSWSNFLGRHTGDPLREDANEGDERSEAP